MGGVDAGLVELPRRLVTYLFRQLLVEAIKLFGDSLQIGFRLLSQFGQLSGDVTYLLL